MYKNGEVTDDYLKYRKTHKYLGYISMGSYLSTATFSIFAPPSFKYKKSLDSIKLHRYISYVHFTGMILQPYLGYLSVKSQTDPTLDRQKILYTHTTVGIITYVSLLLSMLTTLLP